MTGTRENHVKEFGEENLSSEVILRAIEAVSNQPLLELPPLQESIDVDSVNQLFDDSTTIKSLLFEYAEYEITVEPGRVRVRERC